MLKKIISTFTSKQFQQYFISGITSFLVDFLILNFILSVLNYKEQIYLFSVGATAITFYKANLISTFAGMIMSYYLNKTFAFKSEKNNKSSNIKEKSKFLSVVIFNFLINNTLFALLVNFGINAAISKVFVVALQTIWTFILYKVFVFTEPAIDSIENSLN